MRALVVVFAACVLAGAAASAHARASVDLRYRLDEVYSTAVRFVRVDRACKVTDKDPSAAFVIFECPLEDKKVSRGSLELFHTQAGVRVQVTLPDETHGDELRFVELLERKLRDERGTPAEPPTPPPPPKPSDAGAK